jgi:hypothetical protein
MKKRIIYIVWAFLYALCAGLGHITEPSSTQSVALTFLSLLFFAPPAVLLVDALRSQDKKTLLRIRTISIASLGLTLLLLILNVTSVLGSDALGMVLHELLIFASVPMICSRHWVLSLFLWACLLFASLPPKKKA